MTVGAILVLDLTGVTELARPPASKSYSPLHQQATGRGWRTCITRPPSAVEHRLRHDPKAFGSLPLWGAILAVEHTSASDAVETQHLT